MYYGRYLLLILEINAELIYDEAKIVIHFSDFTCTNVLSHKFKRMGIIFQHHLLVIPPTCSVANWSESFKKSGLSKCGKDNLFITGFYRLNPPDNTRECMLLAFSQPVNCIIWPIKTLNWLVAASQLHKHRGTCCIAEWPYCPFAILCLHAKSLVHFSIETHPPPQHMRGLLIICFANDPIHQ